MASGARAIQATFEQLSAASQSIDASNVQPIIQTTVAFIGQLVAQAISENDRMDAHGKQLNDIMMTGNNMSTEMEQIKAAVHALPGQLALRDVRIDELEKKNNNADDIFNKHSKTISDQFNSIKAELQQLAQVQNTMTSTIGHLSSIGVSAPRSPPAQTRAIMELKAISNLRTLKTKAEFRLWNDRLTSALDQARPKLRIKFRGYAPCRRPLRGHP